MGRIVDANGRLTRGSDNVFDGCSTWWRAARVILARLFRVGPEIRAARKVHLS